jgi:hypothetical protein
MISDSRNELVENTQHVPDLNWFLTGGASIILLILNVYPPPILLVLIEGWANVAVKALHRRIKKRNRSNLILHQFFKVQTKYFRAKR